jgi:hypothetical protein
MTLPGLNVTQYMYVLFDQVHISIKNLSLHWRHVQKCLLNIWGNCKEPHQITEILIINFDERYMFLHRIKDKLVLNATAVSDF